MSESHQQVQQVRIEQVNDGQRVDNFLFRLLKGVPRSRVYRFIRRGEVRINKKRCKPETKLSKGDVVRIPPFELPESSPIPAPGRSLIALLESSVLHEDDYLLVLNKPAGIAVHGGSGIRLGLIEAIRQIRPEWRDIELAHRLDRDTSGCIVLCKNLSYLKELQKQLKAKTVEKDYLALVFGSWPKSRVEIAAPLIKNHLSSGERIVRVEAEGKAATTNFKIVEPLEGATLVQASPLTGRTHQIRVHCQHAGHSIVGDQKYRAGEKGSTERLQRYKQLCLHAARIAFIDPVSNRELEVSAELDQRFADLLDELR